MGGRRLRRGLIAVLATASVAASALAATGAFGDQPKLPLNDLNTALGVIPGYQTPAQATEQQNPEPSYDAVPRADCGPGSQPLAGVQGRVPASAIQSGQAAHGWTCNLSVAGHYASSGGYKVWSYTDTHGHLCAFYDTTLVYPLDALSLTGPPSSGVYVLDMSDPSHPVLTDKLTTLPMLSPHESLYLNAKRGLLAADLGNPASYPGLMSIYDVSQDCRHPVARRDLPRRAVRSRERLLARRPDVLDHGRRRGNRGGRRQRSQASAHDLGGQRVLARRQRQRRRQPLLRCRLARRRPDDARRLPDPGPQAPIHRSARSAGSPGSGSRSRRTPRRW